MAEGQLFLPFQNASFSRPGGRQGRTGPPRQGCSDKDALTKTRSAAGYPLAGRATLNHHRAHPPFSLQLPEPPPPVHPRRAPPRPGRGAQGTGERMRGSPCEMLWSKATANIHMPPPLPRSPASAGGCSEPAGPLVRPASAQPRLQPRGSADARPALGRGKRRPAAGAGGGSAPGPRCVLGSGRRPQGGGGRATGDKILW